LQPLWRDGDAGGGLRDLSLLLARYEEGMTFRTEDVSIEATALVELGARSLTPSR